ncbi:MAG: response regulator [Anaerolineaceae bacterium]|nr:response regulator [Anaerolineaceae bacterium]
MNQPEIGQLSANPSMVNPSYPYKQFIKDLRSLLNHFYEPNYLRLSPLVDLLGDVGRLHTPSLLQRLLTDAIESLRPPATTTLCSQAWRTYNLLYYRYLQQLTQEEVASQLGVSLRQFGREQATALDVLANYLWDHYSLTERYRGLVEIPASSKTVPEGSFQGRTTSATEVGTFTERHVNAIFTSVEDSNQENTNPLDDLVWLQNQPGDKPAILGEELSTVLEIIQPLAAQNSVSIVESGETTDCELPGLALHPVALRQLLLSLLVAAFHHAPGSQVDIQVRCLDAMLEVVVGCSTSHAVEPAPMEDVASLDMAVKLAQLSQGNLEISRESGHFYAKLRLPVFQPWTILMVDDNSDLLALFQRYTAGTRYHLIGTSDPTQVIFLVEQHAPHAILLDVMMPAIDGWQLLGQLREHPSTHDLPVVICTIVAQEELAYALGASDFLHKPVSRADLLQLLDRLSGVAASTPC